MDDLTQTDAAHAQYGMSRLLQRTFKPRDDAPARVVQELLHAARLYMGLEIAFLSEFQGDRRVFRYTDQAEGMDVIQPGASDPLDESFCQQVVDGRLPELMHNAQENAQACTLKATTELGIGAHISVPVRLSDGSVFGTFCTFSFQAGHDLNERDLALIRVLADLAANLVEGAVVEERELEQKRERIHHVLHGERLHMLWQPIMELKSGVMAGAEALARFPARPHPSPAQWFSDAAAAGLGNELECLAIDKGLDILGQLPPQYYISCNASAGALLEGDAVRRLRDAPLDRMVLEITEHDAVEDYADLFKALAPLRREGLRLAVDDAGAGYASFRHILRLKPDLIKLDMSLTRDIDTDIARRALALALVRFAGEMGSTLIAEGVQTESEMHTLMDLGVPLAQGFFLHRPQPADQLHAIATG